MGIAAVPAVVRCSEQSVQPEDKIHSWAVGERVQQIYSVLCQPEEKEENKSQFICETGHKQTNIKTYIYDYFSEIANDE